MILLAEHSLGWVKFEEVPLATLMFLNQ